MKARTLIGAALVVSGCAASPPARTEGIEKPALGSLGAGVEGAEAEVLYNLAVLTPNDDARPSAGYRLRVHQAIRVLSPGGREAGDLSFHLTQWDDVDDVWMRVVQPNGEVETVDPRSLELRRPFGIYMMYTGARVALLRAPRVEVGSIIERGFTRRSSRPFDLPRWWFRRGSLPVHLSRLVVEIPEGWEVGYGLVEDGAPAEITPRREGRRLVFEKKMLRRAPDEAYAPPRDGVLLRLHVERAPEPEGSFPDWAAVAAWYQGRVRTLEAATGDMLAEARAFVAAHPERSASESLFELVHQRLRYVAVFSGIGAFVPHAPPAVWRSGFGDCKDMSTVFVSLLRAFDIEAHPVLVAAGDAEVVDPRVPSLTSFNHVIVASRADPAKPWRYSDLTDDEARFGQLSPSTAGRDALFVAGEGRLFRLPELAPEENAEWRRLSIGAGGEGRFEARLSGLAARPWRPLVEREDEPGAEADLRRAILLTFFPGAPPGVLSSAALHREGDVIQVEARFDASRYMKRGDAHVRFRLSELMSDLPTFPMGSRESPIWLGRPRLVEEEIRLEGFGASIELPADVGGAVEGWSVSARAIEEAGAVRVHRRRRRSRRGFAAERLPELRALALEMDRFAHTPVRLAASATQLREGPAGAPGQPRLPGGPR